MAQSSQAPHEPASPPPINPTRSSSASTHSLAAGDGRHNPSMWRRLLGRGIGTPGPPGPEPDAAATEEQVAEKEEAEGEEELDPDDPRMYTSRKAGRQVVPGLPRAKTFRRQQSELRDNLMPAELSLDERRTLSTDRRLHSPPISGSGSLSNPRTSVPDVSLNAVANESFSSTASLSRPPLNSSITSSTVMGKTDDLDPHASVESVGMYSVPRGAEMHPPAMDTVSMTTSQYDQLIHDDLERVWILNLSMHFRDKSKREKFFITYRQTEFLWRRVTISLDYRDAPENSLELDLEHTRFQREKNAKIYEAIRESLQDIQFYDTVTNLKLQTTEGRLHVHVVEDVNEIIPYPHIRVVDHLRCKRIKEREIQFDSHMSGFVYKVKVHGQTLIKKEIPGPDTIDEFLYEINALTQLRDSKYVIELYGVVVDDQEKYVKGLLISFAEHGALIDVIYDGEHGLTWPRREKWARQIVEGLSEIHEAGFVQGDFTLSNIVIDHNDDAKIIDINRRGCPVGWEPPEATPLIESNQRISMYIGVKSDLYQLGMVLWALATQDDEPEAHSRPLRVGLEVDCPQWFRHVVDTCLADDPRLRLAASHLAGMFPGPASSENGFGRQHYRGRYGNPYGHAPSASVDSSAQGYGAPIIRTVNSPPPEWPYKTIGHTYVDAPLGLSNEPYYYPMRGRSPPSPIASHRDGAGGSYTGGPAWSAYSYGQGRSEQSLSDEDDDEEVVVAADEFEIPSIDRTLAAKRGSIPPHPPFIEKELALVGAPLVVSADELSDGPGSEAQEETPLAEKMPATIDGLSLTALETSVETAAARVGGKSEELRPEGVPLPPSPPLEEDEPVTSESGGARLEWNELEVGELSHEARALRLQEGQSQMGPTEPRTRIDSTNKLLSWHLPVTTAELAPSMPEAEPNAQLTGDFSSGQPCRAGGAEKPPYKDSISTIAYGDEAARDAAAKRGPSILDYQELAASRIILKNMTPPHPSSTRSSPVLELPDELKGVGSAHDLTDEEGVRAQGAILDGLGTLTAVTRSAHNEGHDLNDRPRTLTTVESV